MLFRCACMQSPHPRYSLTAQQEVPWEHNLGTFEVPSGGTMYGFEETSTATTAWTSQVELNMGRVCKPRGNLV
jgi:hypothetical protein